MNRYECRKCGTEFACDRDPVCPDCGANNNYSNDCKLLYLDYIHKGYANVSFTWLPMDENLEPYLFSGKYSHLEGDVEE